MKFRQIIILLLLSGCVPLPRDEMECTLDSSNLDTVASDALKTGEFSIGDWPRECWWEEWDDPVLTRIIQQALSLNPTLQRAEANLQAAYQIALQKRAKLFPEID